MIYYVLILSMIFCHIVDDYYLQGCLAKMKQKKWWEENCPDEKYKNDFMAFKKWAIENGYKKGLAIDRINSNDDYKPSNCRFITISENSKRVEHKKGVFCLPQEKQNEIYNKRDSGRKLKDLALEYNVSISTIKKILYKERKVCL